jgi:hypothetical protein
MSKITMYFVTRPVPSIGVRIGDLLIIEPDNAELPYILQRKLDQKVVEDVLANPSDLFELVPEHHPV